MTDPTLRDPLTWNCPHIGQDRWGCGAAAGEECNWDHDPPLQPGEVRPRFHAERQLMADGGGDPIPRETLDRIADDLV